MDDKMKLTDEELGQIAGGQDAQIMYAYRCSKEKGGCGLTFAALIPDTPCPHCETTLYLIDLGAE